MYQNKFISLLVDQINIVVTNSSCKGISDLIDSLQEIKIINTQIFKNPDEFSFIDLLFGLIPLLLQELILSLTTTTNETSQVLYTVMEKFKDYIHKYIWVNRCNKIKRWEVINDIKNRRKKKIGTSVVTNPLISIVSSISKDHNRVRRDKRILKNICFNVVKKYLS
ncbi:hypothetical protein Glove_235g7 [Diversispora epigaea]|uniref:Uncharacterized protein n=1 Tax=Diversispora epigaea TaxID=1348612 RepID=A0A397IBJ2_9GLOM|nr:hypothetical protein Glove_235g7 [Diversispora epigaea]